MGKFVNDAIEFSTFGLVDDPLGIDAGQQAATDAAAIQAAASKEAAGLGAESAREAAKIQAALGREAIDETRRQFDVTQAGLQPFQDAGALALKEQQSLTGLLGPEQQQQALSRIQESPGQKFLREKQERSLLRNASAIGGLGGGNVRTALQQQAAGFAQQDLQNRFGRLGQIAGQGQSAATNIGQLGQQASTGIGNILQQSGQAQAAGILGAGQAGSQGLLGSGQATASGILGAQQAEAAATGQILGLGGQILGAV